MFDYCTVSLKLTSLLAMFACCIYVYCISLCDVNYENYENLYFIIIAINYNNKELKLLTSNYSFIKKRVLQNQLSLPFDWTSSFSGNIILLRPNLEKYHESSTNPLIRCFPMLKVVKIIKIHKTPSNDSFASIELHNTSTSCNIYIYILYPVSQVQESSFYHGDSLEGTL